VAGEVSPKAGRDAANVYEGGPRRRFAAAGLQGTTVRPLRAGRPWGSIVCAVLVSFGVLAPDLYAEPLRWHGFFEYAFGGRWVEDQTKHDNYNMLEQRLQLKTDHFFAGEDLLGRWKSQFVFKGDFLVDEYFGGKTDFDLRECNMAMSPTHFLDVRVGRQVLTWGTGDYLFINDVFPKDYESFYIGRDDEYLKKPSDAARFSFYSDMANTDFIVIPRFEPNTLPDGQRLSFFDSFQGGIAGTNSDRYLVEPGWQAKNFEYAMRVFRNFGSAEGALYVFRGFDPSPRSYLNEADRELFYERQDVFGASLRGPFAGGIGNIEAGYVHSPQDDHGGNRLIENSMFKAMAGYEKDLGHDLKVGFQYYYEEKLDYSKYAAALLPLDYFWDQYYHLLTNRITKLFKNQTVAVSLFTFFSPSDLDGYFRGSVSYDLTDQWKVVWGVNIPWGGDTHTAFAQMRRDKNVYIRVRYSF